MIFDSLNGSSRCIKIAEYLVEKRCTIRDAAKQFGISKSTVHKDVSVRLRAADTNLYKLAREVLENNKSERHIRGGEATKRKYLKRDS